MLRLNPDKVELLILGAGWTSTFLIPLLEKECITWAATTTDGRDGTIPFQFWNSPEDEASFMRLPTARTVLIVFPLLGKGSSALLTELYAKRHPGSEGVQYIQLGSTGIWNMEKGWNDENSPYDETNTRAQAEDELREVTSGAVLNLAGLYGGTRQPSNWVDRVITSKDVLRGKEPLHLIHGEDVARAVVALHRHFTPGKRWLVCDLHIYDWWDLATRSVGEEARQKELVRWVAELMDEEGVRALPRDSGLMGRKLDGRAFWKDMGVWPMHGRLLMSTRPPS